jgi:O-antigen ligase
VAGRIHEKPWLGHGIEATKNFISPVRLPVNDTTGVLHPHNSYLQIWVELGLAGALIACMLAILVLRRINQSPIENQPLYFGVFAGIVSLLATGYGLWQSWHLGLIFAAAALCRIVTRVPLAAKSVI